MKRLTRKHWCGSSNISLLSKDKQKSNNQTLYVKSKSNKNSNHHQNHQNNNNNQKTNNNNVNLLNNVKNKENKLIVNKSFNNPFDTLYCGKPNMHKTFTCSLKEDQKNNYTQNSLQIIRDRLRKHKNLYSVYKFLDQNDSSSITQDNLKKLLPEYGIDSSKINLKQMISSFTGNQNSQNITLGEFIRYIKEDSPPKRSILNDFQIKNPLQQFKKKLRKSHNHQDKDKDKNRQTKFSQFDNTNHYHQQAHKKYKNSCFQDENQIQTVQKMKTMNCTRFKLNTRKNNKLDNFRKSMTAIRHFSHTFDWYKDQRQQTLNKNQNSLLQKSTPSKNILISSLNKQRQQSQQKYNRRLDNLRNIQSRDLQSRNESKQFYNQNLNQIFTRIQSAKILGLRSK